MKTLAALLIMVCMCGAALFAQENEDPAVKKGVFATIFDGFAESTRSINEINRENMAAVREESRASFEAATATNSGLTKLSETKGFWNKVKVMFGNMKETSGALAENEKNRRAEIQSQNSYRNVLENQRTGRRTAIN